MTAYATSYSGSAKSQGDGGKVERVLMGSFVPTAGTIVRQWHVIDAGGQVLGRVATQAARLLQGKHKPVYTPHIDTGDHVVVINAATVRMTGRKEEQKLYRYHSGYEGGVRQERAKEVRAKNPRRLVEEAVRGMLPKTTLGEAMWRKLKVYADANHPHQAQQPQAFAVPGKKDLGKDDRRAQGKARKKDADKLAKREVA